MPDALAKTVPIWCAIINRLIFDDHPAAQGLCTPNDLVGSSEHAQIQAKLDGFLADAKVPSLHHLLFMDIPSLSSTGP